MFLHKLLAVTLSASLVGIKPDMSAKTRYQALKLKRHGRYGDTELVHMRPDEIALLERASGRRMTRNPKTGLREAFNLTGPAASQNNDFAVTHSGYMSPGGWSNYTQNSQNIYQGFVDRNIAQGLSPEAARNLATQQYSSWGQQQHEEMYSDANAAPLGIKELAPIAGNSGLNAPLSLLAVGAGATGLGMAGTEGATMPAAIGPESAGIMMPPAVLDTGGAALMPSAVLGTGGAAMMPSAVLDTGGTAMMPAATTPTAATFGGVEVAPTGLEAANGVNALGATATQGFGTEVTGPGFETGVGNAGSLGTSQGSMFDGMDFSTLLKKLGGGMNLLNIASGLYGLNRANATRQAGDDAAKRMDPFGGERAIYAQKLRDLYANPSSVQNLPGYQAGLQAVERSMAANGYLSSGNMMTALHDYGGKAFNDEASRLALLSGASFAPAGGNLSLAGRTSANDLTGKSLASLGFAGMNSGIMDLLKSASGGLWSQFSDWMSGPGTTIGADTGSLLGDEGTSAIMDSLGSDAGSMALLSI